jgi:MFS family permease
MKNETAFFLPYIVVICSILLSITSAFLRPAFGAIIPDIVERKNLSSANSLYKSAIRIGSVIGETASGFIYNAFGASKLFAFNSLTFFLSALLISRLSSKNIVTQKTKPSGNKFSLSKLTVEFIEGVRAITNINGASEYFIMALVINFMATPIFVLMPFQVARVFGSGAETYGLLMASFSVGIIAGYTLSGRNLIKFNNPYIIIYSIVLMCAFFILFSLSDNIYISYLSLFFAGVSNGFWSIIFQTSVQLIMPKESLGRIYSLFGLMSGGLTPIASFFSGFALSILDNNTRILFSICALLMTAYPVIMLKNKKFVSFFDVLKNNYSE